MRITIEIDETRPAATPTAAVEQTSAAPELAAQPTGTASTDALNAGASVENPDGGGTAEETPPTQTSVADTSAGAAPDID